MLYCFYQIEKGGQQDGSRKRGVDHAGSGLGGPGLYPQLAGTGGLDRRGGISAPVPQRHRRLFGGGAHLSHRLVER